MNQCGSLFYLYITKCNNMAISISHFYLALRDLLLNNNTKGFRGVYSDTHKQIAVRL